MIRCGPGHRREYCFFINPFTQINQSATLTTEGSGLKFWYTTDWFAAGRAFGGQITKYSNADQNQYLPEPVRDALGLKPVPEI